MEDFIKHYRQKIRNYIVRLEARSIKWAYPDYEWVQYNRPVAYYKEKLKEIQEMIWKSPTDRFLRDQEMECENRIWELSEFGETLDK